MGWHPNGTWYEWPAMGNVTDIVDVMQYDNQITYDMFGVSLIFGISLLLIAVVGRDIKVALPISLYTTTTISFMLSAFNPPVVGIEISYTLLIASAITVILLYITSR